MFKDDPFIDRADKMNWIRELLMKAVEMGLIDKSFHGSYGISITNCCNESPRPLIPPRT